MQNERYPIEFPAKLSREEYIRSQELLSKRGGPARFQRFTLGLTVLLILVCLLSVAWELSNGQAVDWAMYSLIAVLAAVEVLMVRAYPRILRRRFGFAYDSTLFSGYSYNGVIHLDASSVSKRCEEAITYVKLAQCPLFVEAPDMFIFCSTQGRHIVIPARYLTADDADALRAAAFDQIPAPRRRLFGRLEPALSERLPLSAIQSDGEGAVMMVKMTLTKREWRSLVMDGVMPDLMAELPLKMLNGVTVAATGYLFFGIMPLALFLLATLVLTLLPLLHALYDLHRVVKLTDGKILDWKVYFGDRKIHLRCDGDENRILHIPWYAVTRAVERPDYVDLYATRKFISIPKRCITDMEKLRETVDTYMPPRR